MRELYRGHAVVKKEELSPSVVTLWLRSAAGARPAFVPGQFVNVLLSGHGADAKSYSISSTPRDEDFSITVRAAGAFSRALTALKEGQTLQVSEPCGYFYPVDETTPRACLAGGIGVAPFASIVRSALEEQKMPPTVLLYSNRTALEAVFRDFFAEAAAQEKNFSVEHFITREAPPPGAHAGRIGPAALAAARERYAAAHFFLCGSIPFVRDIRLNLKAQGVPEERIFTESFY